MKIRNISCTQFAGMRDKSISFEDGINIIYGKNESGKSTIVNLLSRTLFQKAKLDGRKDKEFQNLYFPSQRKGSAIIGDFIDGKLSFETETGVYTISKEWGEDAKCILSTPDGVIRNQKQIVEILNEVLEYGEGVYTDILLSSQKNSDTSLQALLDASQKTDAKQEITSVVTQAFAESDGISIEAIGDAISEKIKEIEGAHWDFEKGMPVSKSSRWASGLGEILKSYYNLEDAKKILEEISDLENEVSDTISIYAKKNESVESLEKEYSRFNTFSTRLAIQNERKDKVKSLQEEYTKLNHILSEWPMLADELKNAKKLQNEKEKCDLLYKYNSVKIIADELNEYTAAIKDIISPTDEEILSIKQGLREIATLENKLCGINLAAQIRMLNDNKVQIKSLRTGEILNFDGKSVNITEAVTITIPGVMEMDLLPTDVNVTDISAKLENVKLGIETIYKKYNVSSLEELEKLAYDYTKLKNKIDITDGRLKTALDGLEYKELETAAKAVSNIREKSEIDADIYSICGNSDIARYIVSKETLIEKNNSDYGSIDELGDKVKSILENLENIKNSLGECDDIPKEYLQIDEPEKYLEKLKQMLELKRQESEEALTKKTQAISKLETLKERLDGDPIDNMKDAERIFNEQKSLLAHWKHIEQVFKAKREELSDNPMGDISEKFTNYLNIISDGKVFSEFVEQDKLDMNIYSDNRLMDYGKLSEGTKETVSLAFRLAVLEHLFPNGGGVVVFDDSFANMDIERVTQSCKLIKNFAKHHQVIFLTCREEYIDLLNGNVICFE